VLLIVGGRDPEVRELNEAVMRDLPPASELAIVPGASHLFAEAGALEQVTALAARWFARALSGRSLQWCVMQPNGGIMRSVQWAHSVAEAELAGPVPQRWVHSQGVARRAAELVRLLGSDAGLLASAAVLHDVGYAPRLAVTGFHPIDGARFLRDEHQADGRLVRLVAHHSFALLEAEERGIRARMQAEFPLPADQFLMDALVWCDMTTTPLGRRTAAPDRMAEIVERYGSASLVGRFIRRAGPEILASVARVESALSASVSAEP
jgi:hypothetical protein